jgi:hypothetical protein
MQSLPRPASFTPTKFELPANAPEGLQLMAQKRCVACHGNGAQLVQFRFTANKRVVDSAAVIKQLRTPFKNMPMFNIAQVTDEQAGQIAEYLQSLNKSAAPTILPVSGIEQSIPIWSIIMLVTGFVMLLAGALALARRRA